MAPVDPSTACYFGRMRCGVFACAAFLLTACPASTDDSGTDNADALGSEDDATSDADATDGADPTDTTGEPAARLRGTIIDDHDVPLPSPALFFCGPILDSGLPQSCQKIAVADDGGFDQGFNEAGTYIVKITQVQADGQAFGSQVFFHESVDGGDNDLGIIVVPRVDNPTDLTGLVGPSEIVIDEALTLTVDPSALVDANSVWPDHLGGVEIDEAIRIMTDIDGDPVLHVWALTPFGSKVTRGSIEASVGNVGLAAGQSVKIYEIEKFNGTPIQVGEGTVNDEATAIEVTPVGDGLHELTWLVLTE